MTSVSKPQCEDPETKRIFDALHRESAGLFVRWRIYRSLYSDAPRDVDVLNLTHEGLFIILQTVLFEDAVLRVCKLTESSRTYGNISLDKLRIKLQDVDPPFVSSVLTPKLEKLTAKCDGLRRVRNQTIAHLDVRHAAQNEDSDHPSKPLTREDVDQPVRMLASALNAVAHRFGWPRTSHSDHLVPLSPEALKLIEILQRTAAG
jgi:hypothetical protein